MKSFGRAGRPPAAPAGGSRKSLLDAATHLLLKLGFESTSCDQIVALAGAGKGNLYARYANKEELFAAVVRRQVEHTLRPAAAISQEPALVERLRAVGLDIMHHSLQPDVLATMRMVIATATRVPELARLGDRIGWERGGELVARVIPARVDQSAGALARAKPAAAWQ